ncbi:MAG: anti-sigma factor antagonist [Azospirillum sp.]|nr:anti-sigma factor antagonist [Azospirillum sp.]
MDYGIEITDQEAIVRLSGRLTFNDHVKLRNLIREMTQNEVTQQTLDMSNLDFVDSVGIGMLLIAREELATVKKQFVLRHASGQVKRVLTVAQLGRLITIED